MYTDSFVILDELPEEAHGAVDHPSSLRLLSLGAGHSEGVVHVTFLVEHDLQTQMTSFSCSFHLTTSCLKLRLQLEHTNVLFISILYDPVWKVRLTFNPVFAMNETI